MSPELRIDPLSGLRVIVAGERGSRPGAFLEFPPREPIDPERDPFLPGHEDRTPPELYRLADGDGGWRVRVVPNLYPALAPGRGGARRGSARRRSRRAGPVRRAAGARRRTR